MLEVSAEAKTSAGAPWEICCTRADDASKLNVTFASGLAAVNAEPISLNASVSDAAAKTVMSPDTGAAVDAADVDAADDAVAAVVAGPPIDPVEDPLSSPHAARKIPKSRRKTSKKGRERRIVADRTRLIVSS